MFEYRIDNARAAYDLMKDGWPTKIVSLIGPDINFELPHQGDHHLIRTFHDFEGLVEAETLKGTVWDLGEHELIIPTMADIEAVFNFTADLGDEDRLLVHCHAGRSRSAAALIGILYQHGMTANEAVAAVKAVRPTMIPNRLMIRMMDEYFDRFDDETDKLEPAVKEYWASCTLPGVTLRTQLSGWVD